MITHHIMNTKCKYASASIPDKLREDWEEVTCFSCLEYRKKQLNIELGDLYITVWATGYKVQNEEEAYENTKNADFIYNVPMFEVLNCWLSEIKFSGDINKALADLM